MQQPKLNALLKPWIVTSVFLMIGGCNAEAERQTLADAPETQARVKSLIDKTLKQLVTIKERVRNFV